MKIHRRDDGDVTILELSGNFHGGPDSDLFEKQIERLIEEGRLRTVLLFRSVKWVSSPGIGILARYYAHYVRAGGRMVVAELNERVLTIFQTMIQEMFDVYSTIDEAIAALRGEKPAGRREAAASSRGD